MGEEAVQGGDDVAGVMAIDEAFPAVMDKPAIHIRTLLLIPPVVLLLAPVNTHTHTHARGMHLEEHRIALYCTGTCCRIL